MTEQTLLNFYSNKITYYSGCFANRHTLMILEEPQITSPGDSVEIHAAVANICSSAELKITVNNRTIKQDQDGIVHIKFPASKSIGKHTLPVGVQHVDPGGWKTQYTHNLEYGVMEK